MTDEKKILIVIGSILFILIFFAWRSISILPHKQVRIEPPLSSTPAEAPTEPAATEVPPLEDSSLVVSIPTAEEIKQSIQDQEQKRENMEKLIATRDEKAEKVITAAKAASSLTDTHETISEDNKSKLSPEERAERDKELRDGIKAHIYFPR